MVTTRCDGCGKTFEAKRSARFCSDTCRKRLARSRTAVVEKTGSTLVDVTAAELERVGRLDTPHGQIALSLARRLEGSLADTGSSFAAIAKELRAALDAATAGGEVVGDHVDELRARREARQRAG